MSSISSSLEIARRALLAQQAVLTTVGHNIANAATPGYSRQRVELAAVEQRNGGGVDVALIRRVRDQLFDLQVMAEQQGLGRSDAEQRTVQRLEGILGDASGGGLASTVDEFFAALQDLSVRPEDQTARLVVKDLGDRLAETFNGLRVRIDQLTSDVTAEIQRDVTQANNLLGQLADLQRTVTQSSPATPPNDVLDRRDQLVSQLTSIIGVTPSEDANGTLRLAITGTGVLLLDGTLVAPLSATVDTATDTVRLTAGTVTVVPTRGALSALIEARDAPTGAIHQVTDGLDALAAGIIEQVNRLHASGSGLTEHTTLTSARAVSSSSAALTAAGLPFTPVTGAFTVIVHDAAGALASTVNVSVTAGTTTLDDVRAAIDADPDLAATITGGRLTITAAAGRTFTFAGDTSDTLSALGLNTFFTGSTSRDIALDPVIAANPSKIATARADAGGLVHAGDGSNALALAQLRTALTMGGGSQTFTDFHAALLSAVGARSQNATIGLERQQASLDFVLALQQQTSGVSVDEELITLTQAQNAYGAAARYTGTLSDIFETLLRMV